MSTTVRLVTRYVTSQKIWNASRICVSSLRRGHANLLCIVPVLAYVLPKRAQVLCLVYEDYTAYLMIISRSSNRFSVYHLHTLICSFLRLCEVVRVSSGTVFVI